jgi:hypothetical protein
LSRLLETAAAGVAAAATWVHTAFVPPHRSIAAAGNVSRIEKRAAATNENLMVNLPAGWIHH